MVVNKRPMPQAEVTLLRIPYEGPYRIQLLIIFIRITSKTQIFEVMLHVPQEHSNKGEKT